MMYLIKLTIIILISCCIQHKTYAIEKHAITILTPNNMSFAITEIIRNYSRTHHTIVTGSFNRLETLIHNIEEGDPADIIITDHPYWIKHLKQRGLVNISSITNLAEDKLVLITSKSYYNLNKEIFENITHANNDTKRKFYNNFIIAIPNKEKDLIGNYAEEIIEKSNIFTSQSRIIQNDDIKDLILNNHNIIGITNYTNTYDDPNINIIETFENKLHKRFVYQIALIASENMKEAENFINFLKSEDTLNILKKYGFEIIE